MSCGVCNTDIPPAHLILGVEGVLVEPVTRTQLPLYLRRTSLIETAEKTYGVLPGAIELIQLLFSLPHLTISFFGSKKESGIVVKALLTSALGKEGYAKVQAKVQVLAREHFVPAFSVSRGESCWQVREKS